MVVMLLEVIALRVLPATNDFSPREQVLLINLFYCQIVKMSPTHYITTCGFRFFPVLLGIQPDSFTCVVGQGSGGPFILSYSLPHSSAQPYTTLLLPAPPLESPST